MFFFVVPLNEYSRTHFNEIVLNNWFLGDRCSARKTGGEKSSFNKEGNGAGPLKYLKLRLSSDEHMQIQPGRFTPSSNVKRLFCVVRLGGGVLCSCPSVSECVGPLTLTAAKYLTLWSGNKDV